MSHSQASKRAVCVGINDYTGSANDLSGCVNDAEGWADLLRVEYGFETKLLLDAEATREGVIGEFRGHDT